jgi:hypothetical protein
VRPMMFPTVQKPSSALNASGLAPCLATITNPFRKIAQFADYPRALEVLK